MNYRDDRGDPHGRGYGGRGGRGGRGGGRRNDYDRNDRVPEEARSSSAGAGGGAGGGGGGHYAERRHSRPFSHEGEHRSSHPSRGSGSPPTRTPSHSAASHSPWVHILSIKDERIAKRIDARQHELDSVDAQLLALNQQRCKLETALSHLDRHAAREELNVRLTHEKLDEFAYL
ncbi:hypothetical protein ABC855_g2041 [[Candida] zeylanoides]|jgi:hypothetical protein